MGGGWAAAIVGVFTAVTASFESETSYTWAYIVLSKAGLEEKFPELTAREREILGLIAKGLTNNAIAERLSVSPKTVRNQVSSIFSKLQVADQAAAIIKARNAGLD